MKQFPCTCLCNWHLFYNRCLDNLTDEDMECAAGPVFLRLGNCYQDGRGTGADPEKALNCYQSAEHFLYKMVKRDERMYRESLEAAIEGQSRARKKLMEEIL